MKTSRFLAATLVALSFACLASAQTTIRVTGSTAFRKAFYVALANSLTNPQASYPGTGTLSGSSKSVWTGTVATGLSAGQSVVVQCSFVGSVGGVNAVTNNLFVTSGAPSASSSASGAASAWLSTSATPATGAANTFAAVTVTGSGSTLDVTGGGNSATGFDAANTPHVTMSDSYQGSTLYTSPTLTDTIVGIVPFVFVKGSSNDSSVSTAAANITNVTSLAARALMTNGWIPMSMLTGVAADGQYDVVLTGRDNDSGTRLDALAEPGFGIFSPPLQYQLNGTTTITSLTAFSSSGGYASGGGSAGQLTGQLKLPVDVAATNSIHSGVKFIPIGYAGTSDANNVAAGGANNLKYNGVAYSVTAVQEGQYTFWAYEHIMYKNTYTGVGKNLADNVAARLVAGDVQASGIKYDESGTAGTLRVTRSEEGGVPASLIR